MALLERDRLMRIGVIVGAHGLQGALRVAPETNDERYYTERPLVYVDADEGLRRYPVRAWSAGRGEWLIELEGVRSREQAERLRGGELLLDEQDLRPLAEGEYFQHDLIGCAVIDEQGAALGRVTGVMEAGGGALLQVADGPRAFVLPMVEAVILAVEIEARRIRVRPPPGLLEPNG